MIIRGMEVLQSLNFCWVWFHSFWGENCTIECNLQLSNATFVTVNTNPFFEAVFMSCSRFVSCSSLVFHIHICHCVLLWFQVIYWLSGPCTSGKHPGVSWVQMACGGTDSIPCVCCMLWGMMKVCPDVCSKPILGIKF